MFDAIRSGVRGAKPPRKAGGFGGPRGPPMRGMVGREGTVNGFWGMVPSRGNGQGWVDPYMLADALYM